MTTDRPQDSMRQFYPRFFTLLPAGLILIILAAFLAAKLSTSRYDQAQYFRDTASYAAMADVPVSSSYFWVGERPFTLPLFFKLIGINSQNYADPAEMEVVARWQTWISILSWITLAIVLTGSIRNLWGKVLAFGLCLGFASLYEIGKWDVLLLSESLSFSLFALLLAAWIWLLDLLLKPSSRGLPLAGLAAAILLTTLYTFIRDSNIYFAVMAAAIFAAAALFFKAWRHSRGYWLAYLASTLILLAAQNVSISQGNRWQIFIYDHLAYRIIPDKQALAYFVQAGLPVNDQLLKIPQMRGAVYQDLMLHSPEMAAVRAWTNAYGKSTYFGYLLSQPLVTLSAPLQDAKTLLDGTGMDYRVPVSAGGSVPRMLRGLTRVMFPRLPAFVYAAAWVIFLGASIFGFIKQNARGAWLAVAILLISTYPLMFLVWHGNPMEIPRHADQVAIQFRLAGWMLIALGLDWVFSHKWKRSWTS